MDDLISRSDAIRLAEQGQIQGFPWQFEQLVKLPSAQPEIIRCKDCRFEDGVWYCNVHLMDVEPNGFCYLAKRKEI